MNQNINFVYSVNIVLNLNYDVMQKMHVKMFDINAIL